MADMQFKRVPIKFFPEDLAKAETMNDEEKTDFFIRLRKERRYVYVEVDDTSEDA